MYNFDNFTLIEIKELIKNNFCTNQNVIDYYNNEWWDQD